MAVTKTGEMPIVVLDNLDNLENAPMLELVNDMTYKYQLSHCILALTTEGPRPMKTATNFLWIGQLSSQIESNDYLKHCVDTFNQQHQGAFKLTSDQMYNIIQFCRTNMQDINSCFQQLTQLYLQDKDTFNFDKGWSDIKSRRVEWYRNRQSKSVISDWARADFWQSLQQQMTDQYLQCKNNDKHSGLSTEPIKTALQWLNFDFFSRTVESTAQEVSQVVFGGDFSVVQSLYNDGLLVQRNPVKLPHSKKNKMIILSGPELESFKSLLDGSILTVSNPKETIIPLKHENDIEIEVIVNENKDNYKNIKRKIGPHIGQLLSKQYIFEREWNRAMRDVENIEQEMKIFDVTQEKIKHTLESHDNELSKEGMNNQTMFEAKTNLMIELMNRDKQIRTRLDEANKRQQYFEKAKNDNIQQVMRASI
ncbi:hypothetical protein RFI_01222 [Reticulomyxa filosa]|uniref:Uncharacterized protein n=1 Tax=Reticulomyxa filosa TaxID=46433 RepID=X6PCK6_RETFI|nr:hypothetical protein RFI_01222 [Reticulomyxa filosa]|eukprot:ETO35838.1 hypothetical protein RFI_01222 [Reticulomyxa filosa]